MKNTIGIVVALTMIGCGGGAASGGGGTTSEGASGAPSAQASATQFVAAIDATLAAVPDAKIFEVEIDDDHHPGFLEVEYFAADGQARERFLDPGSMALVEDVVEAPEPDEGDEDAAIRGAVLQHLTAGHADLRARIEDNSFTSHSMETIQELELTMLDGHFVIACEVLREGARSTMFHAIDGSYLGNHDDALAYLAAHPELEVR